jgi:hypothetical protein
MFALETKYLLFLKGRLKYNALLSYKLQDPARSIPSRVFFMP